MLRRPVRLIGFALTALFLGVGQVGDVVGVHGVLLVAERVVQLHDLLAQAPLDVPGEPFGVAPLRQPLDEDAQAAQAQPSTPELVYGVTWRVFAA